MNKRSVSMTACVLWAMVGCAGSSGGRPPANRMSDGQVLAIYDQTNAFDIETGELGLARGASEEVRGLARMVVADHTAVREQVAQLGQRLGLAPAPVAEAQSAAAEHRRAMRELGALSGAAFDRAYLRHEIGFHARAIQAVQVALIPATASAELRQLMIDVLPGFQHHLDETRAAARALGYE